MSFFQHIPVQAFVDPTSFSGIYSEDDYVSDMAQRAAHDYALLHARVQAFEHQHGQYHHCHPHRHQRHSGGPNMGLFAPASLDNFCHGFGPAPARPAFFSANRRSASHSPAELAYRVWQEGERQSALNRRLNALARQQALAREREAQRRRALAASAIRKQQARAAHGARIQAQEARDQEVFFALLGLLGLAIPPVQPSPVAPQVSRQQPPVSLADRAVPSPGSSPVRFDRKGKGKAIDVPVEVTAPVSTTPIPERVPTLKEELQARIHSETDPDVQESLAILYSDLFDARELAQPVAGPSGHKHISFEVPISGPSSPASASPVPVKAEEKIDTTTASVLTEKPETTAGHNSASLRRTSALSPAVAAKLLKFYRARRARKLSLAQIKDIEEALQKLEGAFEFPAHLDFVDRSPSPSLAHSESETETESALAYTANNIPVHAYEHALNDLLTKLDAVESNGDLEVRGRRKEVVKEVERALQAMERRIEESRERSRERSRRGSTSSQVSGTSVTVTPYNVHSSDNKVDVAVAVEEPLVKVLADVDDTKTTSEVEEAFVIAEDASSRDEVPEPELVSGATNEEPVTDYSPSVHNIEPSTVGIPDSGADTCALSRSVELIHGDPSSPIDDDLDRTLALSSPRGDGPAPHPLLSTVDEAAAPASDSGAEIPEQQHVGAACVDVQSMATAADATVESDAVVASPFEPHNEPDNASLSPVAAPEAITRIESSATDATFVTAEASSVPLSAADDSATFSTAGTATPSELELTQPPTPAPTPYSPSTSERGDETFLLSSTPLADKQMKQRRPSLSAGDDELEIIGKDELEAARNDSDWSDVESESDLEVV